MIEYNEELKVNYSELKQIVDSNQENLTYVRSYLNIWLYSTMKLILYVCEISIQILN